MKQGFDIGQQFFGTSGHFLSQLTGVGSLVSVVLKAAIAIAGILLILLLIFGGFSLMMSAGTNNPEQAAKGKQAITGAVIGFIVVFAAYWIVRLIELLTGATILG